MTPSTLRKAATSSLFGQHAHSISESEEAVIREHRLDAHKRRVEHRFVREDESVPGRARGRSVPLEGCSKVRQNSRKLGSVALDAMGLNGK